MNLMPSMKLKGAATREAGGIRVEAAGEAGHFLYGPNVGLEPGPYVATVKLSVTELKDPNAPVIAVDVALAGRDAFATRRYRQSDIVDGKLRMAVFVPKAADADAERHAPIEIRLSNTQNGRLLVSGLELDKLVWPLELMSFMTMASSAEASGGPAHFLYGPYLAMPAGYYHATIGVVGKNLPAVSDPVLSIEVIATGGKRLALQRYRAEDIKLETLRIPFRIPARYAAGASTSHPIEIRLKNLANAQVGVTRVTASMHQPSMAERLALMLGR
jgi:hypothetical protein